MHVGLTEICLGLTIGTLNGGTYVPTPFNLSLNVTCEHSHILVVRGCAHFCIRIISVYFYFF